MKIEIIRCNSLRPPTVIDLDDNVPYEIVITAPDFVTVPDVSKDHLFRALLVRTKGAYSGGPYASK